MNAAEQRQAAKEFVKRWQAMPCVEEEHSRSFWIELAGDVLGIPDPTRVLEFERKVKGRKIDVFYEDMGVLIEQKGRGISLDKASERSKKAGEETPFQQAKWYADNLPGSVRPRWIVTCNFDEFRIYDLHREDFEAYVSLALDELPDQLHLLAFFTDKTGSRLVREKELSVKAGQIVGDLYRAFEGQYKNLADDAHEQRSLNVLIVRIVFLLYAEDAGLLQRRQAFGDYLRRFPAPQMRQALLDLFAVLDTPDGSGGTQNLRDPYLEEELAAFPYVNGGLFSEAGIVVPQFTEQMRTDLVLNASIAFDWRDISPTIFGAVFESTLNSATRREGGMHYTSIENIHKVVDPLFLDGLRAELAAIEGEKVVKSRRRKLHAFQDKLASLRILDPACGSGNFLTESYLSLRRLENRVLESLRDMGGGRGGHGVGQTALDMGGELTVKVSIDQFFGIEINDFAVSVAKTALWIAEEQALDATAEVLQTAVDFLPLKSNGNILEGNALLTDWADLLPPAQCSYIVGNPPFYGSSMCSAQQKSEVVGLFGKVKLANSLDYVCGWYYKAGEYMTQNPRVRCALVSTNSICQGEQVYPVWHTLMSRFDVRIDFAWRTFVWDSEAADKAHVHVVIIGFSVRGETDGGQKRALALFSGKGEGKGAFETHPRNINPYLIDAPTVFVKSSGKPVCNVSRLTKGNQPTDGGNLILEPEEAKALVAAYPECEKWVRPYIGAKDFLNGGRRLCLWLKSVDTNLIWGVPPVAERLKKVSEFRAASSAAPTRKKADVPHLFFSNPQTDEPYLIIPRVSSERRRYVPIAFEEPENIASDSLSIVCGATLYHLGILHSQMHNAWMRVVCGRLESRYRYSGGVVYNNFPWPGATAETLATPVEELVAPEVRARVEACAQELLDARAFYVAQAREAGASCSLADMYDPDNDFLYPRLASAHRALDEAVEAAYGVAFAGDEEAIVAHLFSLYATLAS